MENQISLKQLKENLRDALKNSGCLSTVKAQIRREFVQSITANSNGFLSKKNENMKTIGNKENFINSPGDLHNRVLYSLMFHALSKRNLSNTMSVFVAEYGAYDVKSFLLSELDIVSTLQLGSSSIVYKKMMDHELHSLPENTNKQINHSNSNSNSNSNSLLDYLIDHTFTNINKKVDMAIQTDNSGHSAIEYIDTQLRDVRKNYLQRREEDRLNPIRSVEERMILFERECEERYRRDLEIQVAYIRDNEATKIRLDERRSARLELEKVKNELENDFKQRLDSHHSRERELNRRMEEKERHFQQSLYDARQKMQQEIDDLRNQEHLITRKLELESQGLHILELRVKESQSVLEVKEREVSRREKEAEMILKEASVKSKEEARNNLRIEMEATMMERASLILDRQRFEEEKGYHIALIENANMARQQLRELQNKVLLQEDEIVSYRKRFENMELRKNEEFDMKGQPGRSTNLVTLIHRNADLEARLREREDLNYIAKNEEMQRLTLKLKELQIEFEIDRKNFNKESELLRQETQLERSRTQAFQSKCHDLERQNAEYKSLLAKLQTVNRRDSDGLRRSRDIDHGKRISEMVENVLGRSPMKSQYANNKDSSVNSSAMLSWKKNVSSNNHISSIESDPRQYGSHMNHPVDNQNPSILSSTQSMATLAAMISPFLQQPTVAASPFIHPSLRQHPSVPSSNYQYENNTNISQPFHQSLPQSQSSSIKPSYESYQPMRSIPTPSIVPTISNQSANSVESFVPYDSLDVYPVSIPEKQPLRSISPPVRVLVDNTNTSSYIPQNSSKLVISDSINTMDNIIPLISPKSIEREQQLKREKMILEKERLERERQLQVEQEKLENIKASQEPDIKLRLSLSSLSFDDKNHPFHSISTLHPPSQVSQVNQPPTENNSIIENSLFTQLVDHGDNMAVSPEIISELWDDRPKFSISPSPKVTSSIKHDDDDDNNDELNNERRTFPIIHDIVIEEKREDEDEDEITEAGVMTTSLESKVDNIEMEPHMDDNKEQEEQEEQEHRRQEEDRLAIIEARQRVLERRNKKMQSSLDSEMTSSVDDKPLTSTTTTTTTSTMILPSASLRESSVRSSVQSSTAPSTVGSNNEMEADSLSEEEFEASQGEEEGSNSSSDSNYGWF